MRRLGLSLGLGALGWSRLAGLAALLLATGCTIPESPIASDSLPAADSLQTDSASVASEPGESDSLDTDAAEATEAENTLPPFSVAYVVAKWEAVVNYASTRWANTIIALVAASVFYILVRKLLGRLRRSWAERTQARFDDHLVRFLQHALSMSILMGMATFLVWHWWDPLVGTSAEGQRTPSDMVVAVWIGLIFFPLGRFVGDLLSFIQTQVLTRAGTGIDQTALPLINRVVRFLVVSMGIVLALSHAGLNIAPLLAGAGVMGLALSLAAKDTLSNLIAGVLLILDRPFQVGDRIELWTAPNETGTWGDVIEVGLRATKIRNPDNLVVVVPNNEIMQRDIVNYTMSGQAIRLRIPFSVAYEADIDRAKDLLVEATTEVNGVKLTPKPFVIVRNFGPSEVNLQLRVWIKDARNRRRIADDITGRALASFAEAGVEIPYPRREIFIRKEPEQLPPANPDAKVR